MELYTEFTQRALHSNACTISKMGAYNKIELNFNLMCINANHIFKIILNLASKTRQFPNIVMTFELGAVKLGKMSI